jgi:hypothetical protein
VRVKKRAVSHCGSTTIMHDHHRHRRRHHHHHLLVIVITNNGRAWLLLFECSAHLVTS